MFAVICPGLEDVVIGDLLDLDQTRALAEQINALGEFDIIIHNAGEYGLTDSEILNANSLSQYWTVFGVVILAAIGGGILYVRRRTRQDGADDA